MELYNVFCNETDFQALDLELHEAEKLCEENESYYYDESENVKTVDGGIYDKDECTMLDDGYYHDDDVKYCDYSGEYFHKSEGYSRYNRHYIIRDSQAEDNCNVTYISYADSYFNSELCVYCEDAEEDYLEEDAYHCERNQCWYADPSNCNISDNEHICEYHDSPECDDLSNGSKFKIGFEVEKINFFGNCHVGDYIGQRDIFKGYETDSSCGVEAITNILPLSTEQKEYVFGLIDDAENVINSDYNTDCGGHINLSCDGYNGYELFDKLKTSLGIFYALYRFRLNNTYCCNNKELAKENNTKYSPINIKNRLVEIRLPSAVKNTKQLKLRYELCLILMHHCTETNETFNQLLDKLDAVLMEMYNEDLIKVEAIKSLAKDFHLYLLDGTISNQISEFLN